MNRPFWDKQASAHRRPWKYSSYSRLHSKQLLRQILIRGFLYQGLDEEDESAAWIRNNSRIEITMPRNPVSHLESVAFIVCHTAQSSVGGIYGLLVTRACSWAVFLWFFIKLVMQILTRTLNLSHKTTNNQNFHKIQRAMTHFLTCNY